MLNSKNIHIAVLGIILGSAIAYVYGTYRLEAARRAEAEVARAIGAADETHPEVTDDAMLAFFTEALAANPNDPELMSRFADFLFGLGQYQGAADWFARALAANPDDAPRRTAMATALYGAGHVDEAIEEFQRAIATDPGFTLALHNLALAYLDARNDVSAAEATIRQLEAADPGYPDLASLRARVAAAR